MKFNIIVLLLTSLFQVQLATSQSAPFQKLIEERFLSFPNNAEVAIGIVDGNNTYKLGYQVMDGKLIAVDNASTLYEIGSISKTFVAALLTNEIEKGTMSLEDPIQTHFYLEIKKDSYQGQKLSLLHLATHTSGLKKNPLTGYKRYSNYLSKVELDYVPGKNWEYNNMGVSLLAELLAEKNNSTWSDVLKENILKPLEMTNTYSNMREAPETGRVQCVTKNGTKGDCYFHKMGSFHWASGGIISNVDDMTKWLKANMGKNIENDLNFIKNAYDPLADTTGVEFYTRYNPTQGIIWQHFRAESGNRIICHAGGNASAVIFYCYG